MPELESGLPSIPEKPGRIFDEGENMVRIVRLPHDAENVRNRYTVVPRDFAARLKALPREESLQMLRAYAEERFKEIQDMGIACSPRTISTDVVISGNVGTAGAEPMSQLLVATRKIDNFRAVEEVEDIGYLTPEQQRQWYDDCVVLYGKLLTYYRTRRYAATPGPLMGDITRLRQYAYLPDAVSPDERFILLDVDIVVGEHKQAYGRFLTIAIDILHEAASHAAANSAAASQIQAIESLEHEFKEEMRKL